VAKTRSRSSITLYSERRCARCHQVRFVLAMKGVDASIVDSSPGDDPDEDLLALNPSGSLPTLVDRDLTLFDADIICEYLDERYPFPALWPTDPAARARARLMLKCWVTQWHDMLHTAMSGNGKTAQRAMRDLSAALLAHAEGFAASAYFMHNEPTQVDCALAPLLWAMDGMGTLPDHPALRNYTRQIFRTPSFLSSRAPRANQ